MTDTTLDDAEVGTVITVYTREECHLCSEALATVRGVCSEIERSIKIRVVDVDDDPELRAAYGDRVPYVFVDGMPTFKYRVDEQALRSELPV